MANYKIENGTLAARRCGNPARDGELAARRDNAAAAESDGTLFGSVERLVDVAQFNADREWDHLAVLALIDAVRTLAAAVKKGED